MTHVQHRTKPAERAGYLPTLDGWRAIAIVLVLCNHAPVWPHLLNPLAPLSYFGSLGVDLFFAISGLLICTRLLEEERLCGIISMRGFYLRRAFRILPPAIVYLAVVALLGALALISTDWPGWWSALLFYRNYWTSFFGESLAGVYTGHFWSLSIEEHFYLLLPAILVFFPRKRRTILLWLTVFGFAWLILYLHLIPDPQRSFAWERRTDLRIASLLFPAWLALQIARPRVHAWFTKLLRPETALLVMLLCLAAYGIYHHHKVLVHPVVAAAPVMLNPAEFLLRGGPATPVSFVVPIVFPFLILATMLHPRSWTSRLLELAPLRFIGRLSYSIYLWQQIFWLKGFHPGGPLIGLALTFLAAGLSFYLVERPLMRLGHRLAPPATPGHPYTEPAVATANDAHA